MVARVSRGTLGAHVTVARVVRPAGRAEVVRVRFQRTGALLAVVRRAVGRVPVEAGRALLAPRPGRVVLARLQRATGSV